jgi:hypothetical protein
MRAQCRSHDPGMRIPAGRAASDRALVFDGEDDSFSARDLDGLPHAVTQDGAGEGGDIRNRALGGICFIFTHNPKCLFAAVVAAQSDRRPEESLTPAGFSFDDFSAGMPRSPVSHLAQSGSGGELVAFVDRGPVGCLKTSNCRPDRAQAFGSDKIAKRRYRAIREVVHLNFGFLCEGATHCLSLSITFLRSPVFGR